MLGDRTRLRELLERSIAAAERHAGIDGPGIERRLAALDRRRARTQDAYEEGLYELPEPRKRLDAIDSERAQLLDLMAELGRDVETDPQVLAEIATTFATWSFLTRRQKRKLLKGHGALIEVRRPERGVLELVRVNLQSVAIEWIYK